MRLIISLIIILSTLTSVNAQMVTTETLLSYGTTFTGATFLDYGTSVYIYNTTETDIVWSIDNSVLGTVVFADRYTISIDPDGVVRATHNNGNEVITLTVDEGMYVVNVVGSLENRLITFNAEKALNTYFRLCGNIEVRN